jgi:hypothetical protein
MAALSFAWTATIVIRPTYTTDDQSLDDTVAQAIQDATGYAATVQLQSVQDPSAPDPVIAAGPSTLQSIANATSTAVAAVTAPVGAAFQGITGEANTVLILVAIVGVALALIIGYGPNVKKLATVSA